MKEIIYCGHSAIIINGTKKIAIDPWLKGNPLCPESLQDQKDLDFIVLTHGHSDHAGDVLRLAKESGAKVLGSFELINLLIKDGLNAEQAVHMNKGGSIEIDEIQFTLVHALHSNSYQSLDGQVSYAGEACGVVITDNDTTIYHAGDTAIFSDMSLIGEMYEPTIAFLPIGDTFTMGAAEAALAASFVKAQTVIPIHYKTFDALTDDAEGFIEFCAGYEQNARELEVGTSYSIENLIS